MKKVDCNITRFEDGEFWIDIIDSADSREAWISGKNYGISELMFGMPKKKENGREITFVEFCRLAEAAAKVIQKDYLEEYGE